MGFPLIQIAFTILLVSGIGRAHGLDAASSSAPAAATAAPATAPNINSPPGDMHLVAEGSNTYYPFSTVGQLANGCTAFLIGPCHVMTVAHCVLEPWRQIWWAGLDFYPGRNVAPGEGAGSSGWVPLGKATKIDVVVHPNWTVYSSGSQGKPAADAAIIVLKEPVGRKLGWLNIQLPAPDVIAAAVHMHSSSGSIVRSPASNSTTDMPRPESAAAAAAPPPVAGTGQRLAKVSLNLQRSITGTAGSTNSSTASAGQQQKQDWLQKLNQGPPSAELMDEVVTSADLPLHVVGYPDNKPNGTMWEQCCSKLDWQLQGKLLWHDCKVRGGHSGSPVYVVWPQQPPPQPPLQAKPAANSSSSSSRVLLGQPAPGSSNSSTLLNKQVAHETSTEALGYVQVVGVHSSSLQFLRDSPTGVFAEAVYAQELAEAAAGSSKARNGQCVVGAGGRDSGGVSVLLPVAVPFTGDTYAWIQKVLQEQTCRDG